MNCQTAFESFLDRKRESSFHLQAKPVGIKNKPEDSLELLLVDWTFGTEELSAYSEPIQQVEGNPYLLMHPRDASKTGSPAKRDAPFILMGDLWKWNCALHKMAPGVIVIPKHRQLAWQKLKSWPVKVGSPLEPIDK